MDDVAVSSCRNLLAFFNLKGFTGGIVYYVELLSIMSKRAPSFPAFCAVVIRICSYWKLLDWLHM